MSYTPRLKQEFNDRIVGALKEEFSYANAMQVPNLEKIVISRGVGAAVADKKLIDHAVEELTAISASTWYSFKKPVGAFVSRRQSKSRASSYYEDLCNSCFDTRL